MIALFVSAALVAAPQDAKPASKGKSYAVLVGVNEYSSPGIRKLRYAVGDAKLMRDTLTQKCGYEPENILLMVADIAVDNIRKIPTLDNMRAEIPEFLDRLSAEDSVLVFLSGHGFVDDKTGKGYFAPSDCKKDRLNDTGMPMAELRGYMDKSKARNKLLLVDSCHSGTDKAVGPNGESDLWNMKDDFSTSGFVTITSCMKNETSLEAGERKRSLFTHHLAEALSGAADLDKDGVVYDTELYSYIFKNVKKEAWDTERAKQNPAYFRGPEVLGGFPITIGAAKIVADVSKPNMERPAADKKPTSIPEPSMSKDPSEAQRWVFPGNYKPLPFTNNQGDWFISHPKGGENIRFFRMDDGVVSTVPNDQSLSASLVHSRQYRDFKLRGEFRMGTGANSGVLFRRCPDGTSRSMELQFLDEANDATQTALNRNGSLCGVVAPPSPMMLLPNGAWNRFEVIAHGDRVTTAMNGKITAEIDASSDDVRLRLGGKLAPWGTIAFQNFKGDAASFRNIEIEDLSVKTIFDGRSLAGWTADNESEWKVEDGTLIAQPPANPRSGGWLSTEEEYSDFVFEFEYLMPEGGNSGVAIFGKPGDVRTKVLEVQLLDDEAERYANLAPQYKNGSVYKLAKPIATPQRRGEWNSAMIQSRVGFISVYINSTYVSGYALSGANEAVRNAFPATARNKGRIGLQSHTGEVKFRNIRVTRLSDEPVWTPPDQPAAAPPQVARNDGNQTGSEKVRDSATGRTFSIVDGKKIVATSIVGEELWSRDLEKFALKLQLADGVLTIEHADGVTTLSAATGEYVRSR